MKDYYLEQMGITQWQVRAARPSLFALQQLTNDVSHCTRCPLHQNRTQTVFARGNPQSKVMIIGEAPGYHEDQQGLPFVGAAGQLLDRMLASIGLDEDQIYITNILKCRPPNNRDPELNEIVQCTDYLTQQIALVKPQLLLALGRFAGQFLLNTSASLAQMRKLTANHQDIPVIVTYHPAYLLRNPADKKNAYQDWLTVQERILSLESS